MKVMLRQNAAGHLVVYIAKKDIEEEVVNQTEGCEGQIFTLANGWELAIPDLSEPLRLPQTIEAKRLY
ncbi:putative nitrogen fixation protein NifT [Nostoc sp. CALU 546]|uniref:putative nitrogen fixation protein NifT n=1 Tax=Nostoc sp. CALU 546 TaxID=1867241 RepID=UPI003B685129